MKTSNKILLGIFFTLVLVFTAIHLALYAKYKSGDYTIANNLRSEQFTKAAFPKIHYVSATGLQNFNIYPADTLQLEVQKEGPLHIEYRVVGDTLVISGDTIIRRQNNKEQRIRSYQEVNLYLPSMCFTRIDFCEAWMKGFADSAKSGDYNFDVNDDSFFHVAENEYEDSSFKYLKKLSIRSSLSQVELSPNIKIGELQLDAKQTEFDDKKASIGKISIQSDNNSAITLRGNNIQKLITPPVQ